jgi:hypothetical protein
LADQPTDPQGSARVGVVAQMIRRLVARVLREAGWILDDLADHVHPLERRVPPEPSVYVEGGPVTVTREVVGSFVPPGSDRLLFITVDDGDAAERAAERKRVREALARLEVSEGEPFLWGCGEGHVE